MSILYWCSHSSAYIIFQLQKKYTQQYEDAKDQIYFMQTDTPEYGTRKKAGVAASSVRVPPPPCTHSFIVSLPLLLIHPPFHNPPLIVQALFWPVSLDATVLCGSEGTVPDHAHLRYDHAHLRYDPFGVWNINANLDLLASQNISRTTIRLYNINSTFNLLDGRSGVTPFIDMYWITMNHCIFMTPLTKLVP